MKKVYLKSVKDKINEGKIKAYIDFIGHMFEIKDVSEDWILRVKVGNEFFRSFYCTPYTVIYVES